MECSLSGFIRSTIYPLCSFHLYLSLCRWSLRLWWLLNDGLKAGKLSAAVLSAYSFSTNLLNSLTLPSLLSSSLLAVWSVPLLATAERLQTILEEDLEDPVYQVTLWQITWLLSLAAFLAGQLALLCVHCGETRSLLVPQTSTDVMWNQGEVRDTKLCDPGSCVFVCMFRCMTPLNKCGVS